MVTNVETNRWSSAQFHSGVSQEMVRANGLTDGKLQKHQTLRFQLLVIFGVLIGALLLVTGVSVVFLVSQSEQRLWSARQLDVSDKSAEQITTFLNDLQNTLLTIALIDKTYYQSFPDLFEDVLNQNPEFLELTYLDRNGKTITSRSREIPVLGNLFTATQAVWFRKALAGESYLGQIELSANREPYVILALPASEGVIAARVRMGLLWESVKSMHFGASGNAYIINSRGQIIAHPDPDIVINQTFVSYDSPLMQAYTTDNPEWHAVYTNFNNEPRLGMLHRIAGTDWAIVTEVLESEAFETSRLALLIVAISAFCVEILVLRAIMYMLDRRVLQPLHMLREGTEIIGGGDLSHHVDVCQTNEFGIVAAGFNEMVDSLRDRDLQLTSQAAALAREVQHHVQTERALRESESTTMAVLEGIPDALIRIDRRGVVRNFRASRDHNPGTLPEQFTGKHVQDFMPHDLIADVLETISVVLDSRGSRSLEFEMDTEIGLRDFEIRLVAMNGDEVLAIVRDITERKRQEEILQKSLERERQLGEMKSRFMSLMSHEFRTPLAIIVNSQDLLSRYASRLTDEKRSYYLQSIKDQVFHLNQILEDILTISRAETVGLDLQAGPVDVEQLCRSLIEESQVLTANHRVKFSVIGEHTLIHLDGKLIRRALLNLLSNAAKYSAAGSQINFELVQYPEKIVFRIQDAGIGIPEEDQKHLFDVFYRARNTDNRPGVGLGLSIVKQAVQLHGGAISFESHENVGTTFTISLPVDRDSEDNTLQRIEIEGVS